MADNNVDSGDQKFRFGIAKWTIIFVFTAIIVLGVAALIAVVYSDPKDDIKFRNIKDIIGILLPVLGTWAGTVFAFYFSRENFESASKSTASLVKQLSSEDKLRSLKASENMIPIVKATTLVVDKKEEEIKLQEDIIKKMFDKEKRERLPILDANGIMKYIAHRSIVERFILKKVAESKSAADLTLADLAKDEEFGKIIKEGFKTIKPDANLAQAKAWLDSIVICADIFVTEDGTEKSKVLGWITNIDILEKAKV